MFKIIAMFICKHYNMNPSDLAFSEINIYVVRKIRLENLKILMYNY
jgi:hypothetical protein